MFDRGGGRSAATAPGLVTMRVADAEVGRPGDRSVVEAVVVRDVRRAVEDADDAPVDVVVDRRLLERAPEDRDHREPAARIVVDEVARVRRGRMDAREIGGQHEPARDELLLRGRDERDLLGERGLAVEDLATRLEVALDRVGLGGGGGFAVSCGNSDAEPDRPHEVHESW